MRLYHIPKVEKQDRATSLLYVIPKTADTDGREATSTRRRQRKMGLMDYETVSNEATVQVCANVSASSSRVTSNSISLLVA